MTDAPTPEPTDPDPASVAVTPAVPVDPVDGSASVDRSAPADGSAPVASVDGSALVDAADGSVVPAYRPGPVLYAGLLVGGLLVGLVGVGLVAVRTPFRGTMVPWGLVLVLVALGVCLRGAAWVVGSRRGAIVVAIGWVLPTLAFAATGPGGDVLLPDVPRTRIYLIAGALLAVLASTWRLPKGTRELVEAGGHLLPTPTEPLLDPEYLP